MVPKHASHGHVAGFSRDLLLAWHYNRDNRTAILERHPGLKHVLNERCLGTNTVEMVFSMVVYQAQSKPKGENFIAILRNICRRMAMKRDPNNPFSIPVGRKRRYSSQKAASKNLAAWNDSSLLGDSGDAVAARAANARKVESESKRKCRTMTKHSASIARDCAKKSGVGGRLEPPSGS